MFILTYTYLLAWYEKPCYITGIADITSKVYTRQLALHMYAHLEPDIQGSRYSI